MKDFKAKIKLYDLGDLPIKAKERAITEHFFFMCSNPPDYEDDDGNMVTETNYEPTDEEVIDNIEINDYLFYRNGKLADVTFFTGKHPKTGEVWLNLHGDSYLVESKKSWFH